VNGSAISIRALPPSLKAVFTAFLLLMGVGYVMALFYLFLVDVDPHRKMGLTTTEGVIRKYYGKRETTKLEASIRGSMSEYVSPADRDKIVAWLNGGATRETYPQVERIIAQSCVSCHSAGGTPPPLTTFEEVSELTEVDLGLSVRRLAAVSHVHLFGIAFVFVLTGAIFSLCELREWFKVIVVCVPFVAMLLDIGSWWLTHYQALFAYTVIAGGALMSLVVPIQILVPLYQMWWTRSSPREQGQPQESLPAAS